MQRLAKIFFLILTSVFLQVNILSGQGTYSPYSVYGLGSIEGNSIGPSKAMGGTGIALMSDRYVNMSNPASYSGIDSLVSIFEIGAFAKYTSFSTSREQQSLVNANLKYVLMGFRVSPWLTTSFGFAPYSSVGYNINTTAQVDGTLATYKKTYTGDGGVNQAFVGGAVQIFKNLSVGVNAAYLFGNITHEESSDVFSFALKDVTTLSNLDFRYGLNYHFAVKDFGYYLGLTYENQKKLRTSNETTITTGSGTTTLEDNYYKFAIPRTYGAGVAVTKNFFKAGIDYERSLWKDIRFKNSEASTRNSDRISLGVEFPSQGYNKGTGKMIIYRFGAEYRGSYLLIKDTPVNYYAVSLGAGFPLRRNISIINVSLEVGQNGTREKGLFRENFVTLNLDFSLRDLWFIKRLYE